MTNEPIYNSKSDTNINIDKLANNYSKKTNTSEKQADIKIDKMKQDLDKVKQKQPK